MIHLIIKDRSNMEREAKLLFKTQEVYMGVMIQINRKESFYWKRKCRFEKFDN